MRRRELMRQRALARAQIGMGQEEVMAKEEEKEQSASENEEETTEEETTDSEVSLNAYMYLIISPRFQFSDSVRYAS